MSARLVVSPFAGGFVDIQLSAQSQAAAKRARKAAKREEDARRTREGRDWARYDLEHLTHDRPHGLWDREERFWRCNPPHDCAGFTPRWRARLNHRRSLPWAGYAWLDSRSQARRLHSPRNVLTRVRRAMRWSRLSAESLRGAR